MKKLLTTLGMVFIAMVALSQTASKTNTVTIKVDGKMVILDNNAKLNKEQLIGNNLEIVNYQLGSKCSFVIMPAKGEEYNQLYLVNKPTIGSSLKSRFESLELGDRILIIFENQPDGTENYSVIASVE